ncbi:MAG: AAA family ATPase, partial [Pseudomonadota bacterium]
MSDISLETIAGKLNEMGRGALMKAHQLAKKEGNRNIELAHWLFYLISTPGSDVELTLDHYKIDKGRAATGLAKTIDGLKKNQTELPQFGQEVLDAMDRGWIYATLLFGEPQIRTGHLLVAILKDPKIGRTVRQMSAALAEINVDQLAGESRIAWKDSLEETMRPSDGSSVFSSEPDAADPGKRGTTALDRFTNDLTAKASEGAMDPIVGRDEEIRQLIDVLLRRRQNNPILTGEAGVGKTAVVEGFAQRLASGDVPPKLQGVRLCELDIGLMQAGASMKGEFEQRLRSVIDEVQGSETPIILFIDEAHTLIGAGGAAGTGDAANLLKPALARGTLRTIGATTFAEYRNYFEKDP